jgi:hypothetical protein
MKKSRNILLIIASISLITVIGGAVYEHLTVVPQFSSAPPSSLAMFQGKYGLDAGRFWRLIHPVTVFWLLLATIVNWKTERRKYIIWPFGSYLIILVITATYFVPELLNIIHTPFSNTVNPELKARADHWELLSLIRLGFSFILAGILLYSLTKSADSK